MLGKDKYVQLNLWEAGSGGREDYDRLTSLTYAQTNVFLMVYSVLDPASLERIKSKWAPEVAAHCPNAPLILVANKVELRDDLETIEKLKAKNMEIVNRTQGEEMAKKIGAVAYMECSAYTQQGLVEVFKKAISVALEHSFPSTTKKENSRRCSIM